MYDTSNPFSWKYLKTVEYPYGQWTITDASLSPDNRFLAYSSIRNAAYLAPTDPDDDSDPIELDFALLPNQPITQSLDLSRSRFGVGFGDQCQSFLKFDAELTFVLTDLVTSIFGRRPGGRSWDVRELGDSSRS